MKIKFSRHAKRRMKERAIMEDDIVEAIKNPDQITPSIKGRVNYIKNLGGKHLKVTCKEESNAYHIITVMNKQPREG